MRHRTVAALLMAAIAACGGVEQKRPDRAPRLVPRGRVRPFESASASAAPPPPATPLPPSPPAPGPKGKFISFAFAASSGKVDKVGSDDGAFTPDGIKDLVFDAEVEGAPVAFIIVSTDASGKPTGAFRADTFVGTQLPPSEEGAEIKPGLMTAGIAVFEGDKLANTKDGALTPLSEGRHMLTLHVSSRATLKGFTAYAMFDDRTLIGSPVASRK